MASTFLVVGPLVLAALLLHTTISRYRVRSTVARLPGPSPGAWLVGMATILAHDSSQSLIILSGNLPDIFRPREVGDADFEWTNRFGNALRIKGSFGVSLDMRLRSGGRLIKSGDSAMCCSHQTLE